MSNEILKEYVYWGAKEKQFTQVLQKMTDLKNHSKVLVGIYEICRKM